MSDSRLTDLASIEAPVDLAKEFLLLDNGNTAHKAALKQLFGAGAGAANSRCFREEITEITEEMYGSINDGSFDLVHAGMHYTAPSGRTYFLADADYFFNHGDTQTNDHHFL